MDPERLTAELRPRSPWEAVDFGFALARRHWRPIAGSWLLLVGPVYGLIWWIFFDNPVLAMLLIWWLKPLFGRLTLRVVSGAIFGDSLSTLALVRELPRLWTRALGSSLLLFRLDVWRSLSMPITLLEGVSLGRQASRRTELRSTVEGPASWLTAVCWLLKWVVFFGLVGSVFMLFPEQWGSWADALDGLIDGRSDTRNTQLALLAADFVALGAVEPFYVAGGFGLYINRRADLEGWDVQIGFRRLVRRIAALALLLGLGGAARADDSGEPAPQEELGEPLDAGEVARQVLSDEEFGGQRTVTRYRMKDFEGVPEWDGFDCDTPEAPAPSVPGLACGQASQGALLALVGMVVVVLLIAALRRQDIRLSPRFRSGEAPLTVQGQDEAPLPLPDLPERAQALWRAGEPTRAVGMLYKGAVGLLREQGLPLGHSLTEGECVRVVRSKGPPGSAEPFSRLARVWQLAAYAHRLPTAEEFTNLCEGWGRDFGVRP